ncbi:MAG: SdiA-regulated domain-containing protein [Saprospiraceae bacterium]|nr:SdiA-regulated domain-containing protein [Saprospiraceae bacterium]MDW8483991.1 SdiA-regulated domain-containing protein [Saprospiraceae bacterium]
MPYSLSAPDTVLFFSLTDLLEISGLSPSCEPGVLCAISDERGEVFFLDAATGEVRRRVHFRDKGDFEGVEMVNGRLYALRSNGQIYEITRWKRQKPRITCYETFLTKDDDVEGLCFDHRRYALLLACKGIPDSAHERRIYAFDLRNKRLLDTPVYRIDPRYIQERLPPAGDEKPHYFSPSGLALHPHSGDIYVISTASKRLIVLDYTTGAVRYIARLERHVMPQPEGIAFDAKGRLFIASEGKKGEGRLLRFSPKVLAQ